MNYESRNLVFLFFFFLLLLFLVEAFSRGTNRCGMIQRRNKPERMVDATFFFFFFLLQRKSNGDRIGNRFSRLRVRGDVTRALRNFLKDFGYFANYYYTRDVIFA